MKQLLFLSLLLFATACSNNDKKKSEGKNNEVTTQTLTEITIGEQIWAKENLNLTCFRNGDPIMQAQSDEDWVKAIKEAEPAWCFFHNDSENQDKNGKLYNIYAVLDPRGLAPEGWHIPKEEDWDILVQFLGENPTEKLKADNGWNENGNGNNETGFTAYPSGTRTDYGSFPAKGATAYYWSLANNSDTESSGARYISSWDSYLTRATITKDGYAVRCIKNK